MSSPQKLSTRQLGKDGPQVPRLGFGTMGLSVGYGPVPSEQEQLKVLDRAWELGATFWDTAHNYGDSEVLIGKWFRQHPERRKDIFLATKFGLSSNLQAVGAGGRITWRLDSTPEECRRSCEESLEKLGTEYIDLFYIHRFDKKTPVEKTMEGFVELKNEGKIRHMGFSECSSTTLRRGHAVHPIAAVQIEYNPWTLDIETDAGTNLLATCRELGVAVVPYSPLGRGFMTGRYKSVDDFEPTDLRRHLPRFQPANFARNLELVRIFEDLAAEKKDCTPAQVVLAWILARGDDFFPIPGTKNVAYLEQNLGALGVEITARDDEIVRAKIAEMGGAVGDRSLSMADTFVDTPPL
ncbi:Aldo/keto reductase [Cryphonectria parasitica EP155]|uniref:Aldo/keto reductase n=1 Tax=Cryphonectria parasitica (strain ATCC 38755 / EP155) TaxID=660469 RepID=A0A9P5CMF2_CRYP1|nr:Aldo/keto reductase [Cryphonectria parasitica EP155]KAF3763026.1 Aldo/keto reductase [Cryphonectria parasitica EP155]